MIKKHFSKFEQLLILLAIVAAIYTASAAPKVTANVGTFFSNAVDKVTGRTGKTYKDFRLLIPTLGISVPVVADVPAVQKEVYFGALEDGVAHFAGSKKPGERGNVFIFGHSSFYPDRPGDYKDVFKNLENIKEGDTIIVWWGSKQHLYVVRSKQVVDPDDVSSMQPTPQEQLTLMTCVPPGTINKRLIVKAFPQ